MCNGLFPFNKDNLRPKMEIPNSTVVCRHKLAKWHLFALSTAMCEAICI